MSDVPYMHVLNSGGFPNPPRGEPQKNVPWTPWRVEGGYSKQAPEGVVQPLLDDERQEKRAIDLIVRFIRRELERAANA